jgi:hypothetical protein
MEHPLIPKIEGLTLEELQKKISELHKKLGYASRTGNLFLIDQLRMAIESYQTAYHKELDRLNPPAEDGEDDFGTLIDIS